MSAASQAPEPQPLVSIALCTCNGERFLAEQLDSLLAQDYPNLEIIAVDDASTDGTWPLLQSYGSREPRLRVSRNEHRLGHRENFERALASCRGDFVAPCDQDDVWMPNKISRLLASIDGHSAVYCDSLFVDAAGRSLNRRLSEQQRRYSGQDPTIFVFYNCVPGHSMLVTRDTLQRAMPFPEIDAHDWWLAFVATSLRGIRYVDEVLVHYRRHADTITKLGHERITRRKPDPRVEFERRRRHLAALQAFDGPARPYLVALYQAWCARAQQRWSARLFRLMLSRRASLFFIRDSRQLLPWKKMLAHAKGIEGT